MRELPLRVTHDGALRARIGRILGRRPALWRRQFATSAGLTVKDPGVRSASRDRSIRTVGAFGE